MIVSIKQFKNSFVPVRDNYVIEIKTGKTYVANYLDDRDEVLLLEPKDYEEKIEKLEQKVTEKFEKIISSIV